MRRITLDSPLEVLAGIGVKRSEAFGMLGIHCIGDLLRRFPRAYQNRGATKTLLEAARSGEVSSVILTVGSAPHSVRLKERMTLTKFTAFDETGKCTVVFFNSNYIKDVISLGGTYRFWGRLRENRNGWEMAAPVFEPVNGSYKLPDFVPVYPLGNGISQKVMNSTVGIAIATLDDYGETLPESIRQKRSLCSLKEAFMMIHRPQNLSQLDRSRAYFIYEELFYFALHIAGAKRSNKDRSAVVLSSAAAHTEDFFSALPFTLTEAQKRVTNEIFTDLGSGVAMHRLLGGDVGSGKTVCAAAAAFVCARNGYQCVMMAPTEILARQHYNDLSPLFAKLGIKCELLTGSLTAAKKRDARAAVASGEAQFVIGTHALISDGVEFSSPALMITDEQHRFGLRQRTVLAEKSGGMHTLVMSATPIPRTLALVMYGDLDISTIDTMPPNRKKVSTFLVDESYRERLNGFILKQTGEGRQVYIVCPSIEKSNTEDEEGDLVDLYGNSFKEPPKSAVEYTEQLRAALPETKIFCLHGRMSGAEKDRIMSSFAAGDISVLVSTTVIEVGVNVPNATLMIVENAERFGLSQLHQLRGRVGRGEYKSWCILVSDAQSGNASERMKALCDNSDGFAIAEKDLELRGPGDFFAGDDGEARQHGVMRLRIASLCNDINVFTEASRDAESILCEDPLLELPGNAGLAKRAGLLTGVPLL